MTQNPYQILGIERTADEKAVRAAYRKLAKQYHPDLNPGNKEAEKKFSEINQAYELLKDAELRSQYDRGEIDITGNPTHQQHYNYRTHAEGPSGARYHKAAQFNDLDIEDIFHSFFEGGVSGKQAGFKHKAADAYYRLRVGFMEAARGVAKQVTMPDGKVLKIRIPAGVEDGQRLRLQGQGGQGSAGVPAGDAYVDIFVDPHPVFMRSGNTITSEAPVGLHETVLGSTITVETLDGALQVKVPKGASSGTTLRLKGKGIKGGDHLIKLKLVMPHEIDEELERFMRKWTEKHAYNPREMRKGASS